MIKKLKKQSGNKDEKYIARTAENAGWSKKVAERKMKKAKEAIGISYRDYAVLKFYEIPEEQQKEEYENVQKRRKIDEEKKQNCIEKTVLATGWDEDYALEQIKLAKKETGVSYKNYTRLKLYEVPQEQLKDEYEKRLEKRKEEKRKEKECVEKTVLATGWTEEYALKQIKLAKEETGVSYKNYTRLKMYEVPQEQLKEEYEKRLQKRKEEKRREKECVEKTVLATGWDEDFALKQIKLAKKETGVSYKNYTRLKMYEVPQEQLKDEYEKRLKKNQQDKENREKCISAVMQYADCDRETALTQIKDAKQRTGISYKNYLALNFHEIPPEEQAEKYESFLKRKAIRKQKREHYINQVIRATGWDRDYIVKEMKKAWDGVGASAEMYAVYKFWDVPEEEWRTYFTKGDVNALREKYNKDPEIIKLFMNKDLFCEKFDKFMGRPWCTSDKLTYEVFCEKFGKLGKVIYKPTTRSGGKGVEVFDFNSDNIRETYDQIKALPDGLIEGFFKQHPDLQKFSLKSVNTMRIGTIVSYDNIPGVENGKVNIVYAGLRMGCGDKYVDNLHSGGIMTDIDIDTGVIITDGVDFDNNVYTTHPDTGTKIKGFKIPYFDEMKKMIEEAGAGIEGYYGWDVAIGENGPVIIEVNTNAGPTALQAPYVPMKKGMRHRIEKFL